MKAGTSIITLIVLALAVGACLSPDDGLRSAEYGSRLGSVDMPMECSGDANELARTGLALLHHMTYEGARAVFADAREADPSCTMAYWGGAMTYIHPLWSDPPTEEAFAAGAELATAGLALDGVSDVEQAYLSTVDAYYSVGRQNVESPNLIAFAEAWASVHERFPDDPEAALFHAVTQISIADPSDRSYERQLHASEVASGILERIPDHPGAHHYVIHANDYPALADRAVSVARSYSEIAPAVPHALHMPAHIMTRLGYWPESVDLNTRSSEAALQHPSGDMVSPHYLHAADYLVYARLQQGDDAAAKAWVDTIAALEGPHVAHPASAYAFAAVPARYALERQQWTEAASLKPRTPDDFLWEQYPAMDAIAYFAKGLGAARSGDVETARTAMTELGALRDRTADTAPYWSNQIEIQRLSVEAWVDYSDGRTEDALTKMRRAAEMESATDKHPVTPGEVLPASELLGDMLLELGEYDEARAAYDDALARSPNRFNSLFGAGRASELAADNAQAATYYERLIAMASGTSDRDRLHHAREALESWTRS